MNDSNLSESPVIDADRGRGAVQIRDNGFLADVDGSFQPTLAHLFPPRRRHFALGGSTGILTGDMTVQSCRLMGGGKLVFFSSFVPLVVETLRSHGFQVEVLD